MQYSKKLVLHCPNGYDVRLDAMVEEFIRDGVVFVGVVGKDCEKVEEIIDELVVGNGGRSYELLTSSHPDESIDEALEFARSLTGKFEGKEVQLLEFLPREERP